MFPYKNEKLKDFIDRLKHSKSKKELNIIWKKNIKNKKNEYTTIHK